MTLLGKSVFIDKLDNIAIDESNITHIAVKMKPKEVKNSKYIKYTSIWMHLFIWCRLENIVYNG